MVNFSSRDLQGQKFEVFSFYSLAFPSPYEIFIPSFDLFYQQKRWQFYQLLAHDVHN